VRFIKAGDSVNHGVEARNMPQMPARRAPLRVSASRRAAQHKTARNIVRQEMYPCTCTCVHACAKLVYATKKDAFRRSVMLRLPSCVHMCANHLPTIPFP
jgi:hypothetical protein